MNIEYDKHYRTENLFGAPYPELIEFYASIRPKGKLLDLGCGQGRDSIALARLGYEVTGIDYSKVGIEQLNQIAKNEDLTLKGFVSDIYAVSNFEEFDFILLDSMFHFGKKERKSEIELLEKVFAAAKSDALITICIQQTGNKLKTLNSIISGLSTVKTVHSTELVYHFVDKKSNHRSETKYTMLTAKKL